MKIWVDDMREPPNRDWVWLKSVDNFCFWVEVIDNMGFLNDMFELVSLDHDAGEYAKYGGDYIKILDYLEANEYNIPIHLHTMNPVGRDNMRRIIQKNNWKEVLDIENY